MNHSSIKAQGGKAEILIYEDIGQGFFGGLGAKAFREQITALRGVSELTIRINSDGGDVFEGIAIYNTLKDFPATKNVIVDGIAASIATVIAMAGDTITLQPTATMMIHNARGTVRGDCTALRSVADLLEMINGQMAVAYARSGKSTDDILQVMAAETWYTAQGAVDAGWADGLVAEPLRMAASIKEFDLSGFTNVPDWVKQAQASAGSCTCPCAACMDGKCADCTDVECECVGCTCDAAENATARADKKTAETAKNEAEVAEIQQKALIAARIRERNLRLAEAG